MNPFSHFAAPCGTVLALAASLALVACGGGSEDPVAATGSAEAAATTASSSDTASAPSASNPAASVPELYAVPTLTWRTSDTPRYDLKTSADLGLLPQSMNSKGVVGGTFNTNDGQYAALWQNGQIQTLLPLVTWGPGGCYKACSGAVSKVDEQGNAFLIPAYYGNTIPPMELLRRGATSAETLADCLRVYAINDAGQFLCDQWTGPGQWVTRSAMWNLQGLDKTVLSGGETAMNPVGTIAGSVRLDLRDGTHHHIFRQKGASFTFLELPGVEKVIVEGINAQDVVIGRLVLPGDNSITSQNPARARPFMWKDDQLVMLPCPQAYGWAAGINRDGTIAGGCYLAEAGDGPDVTMKSIAVLWKDGQPINLSARLGGSTVWGGLTGASAINDLGWILASGYRGSDPYAVEAVLLQPQQP